MQFNRLLSIILKIGLGAILFVPLVISDSMFFPFITSKNFAFRILVEILFTLWIVLALRDRSYIPKRSLILLFVAAAVGALFLGTVFGVEPSKSFWSNFERMEGLLGHLHLLAYFLILVSVNKTERDWKTFFSASIVASLLVGAYAVMQLLCSATLDGCVVNGQKMFEIHQGGTRIDSTLGNATYLAVYLLFHVFLSIYYFFKNPERGWKIYYGAVFLFESYLIYETATRGAILGYIGGLIIFALLLGFLSKEEYKKKFAWGLIGLIFVLGAGFFLIRNTEFVQRNTTLARLRNISLEDDTTKARFYIWQMSLESFKERPIFGWGPENFPSVFSKYFDARLWKQEPWFDRAHNAVFDWLVAGGIIGLAAYLGIFASAVWLLIKKFRESKISNLELSVFVSLLAGYFFQNLFVFDQLTSYILILSVLGYIHFLTAEKTTESPRRAFSMQVTQAGAGAAVLLLIAGLYFFNFKPLWANVSLLSALDTANKGNFIQAQNEYRQAIALSPLGRREAREQYSHFSTIIASREDTPENIRTSTLEDALRESELQAKESPLDARSHLFLGTVYNAAGRRAQALQSFERALAASPKKQQIIFLVAQFYVDDKKYDRAIELASNAVDSDPTYTDAVSNLITLAIFAEKDDVVKSRIEQLLSEKRVSAGNIRSWASMYASLKKYKQSADLYKKAIELDPKDIQSRVSLAATYYEMGRSDLAIEEIKKAIAINPDFKTQGEGFIQELRTGKKP
ncbi:O-antigen ligase family protein [Candidatus Giovannonibacteria bacterium]|nr:O-antigen ligase family protein [Candidatus Giovannonibacteria bacterium]